MTEGIGWRVTPRAREDLRDIWTYGAGTWSVVQADAYLMSLFDAFDLIALQPGMGVERREIDPPVRLHTHRNHVVIYRIGDDGVTILRVVHTRARWRDLT